MAKKQGTKLPRKKTSSAKANGTKSKSATKNKKIAVSHAKTTRKVSAKAPPAGTAKNSRVTKVKTQRLSNANASQATNANTQRAAHHGPQHHLSREERNWGMYCHLAAFLGFIIPFGNIIGPAIIWLLKREEFPSVNRQGKEALNFQMSMAIYFFVAILLAFVIIGFILIPILLIMEVIYIIAAAIKAQEGGYYHYPFTIHFLK